MKKYYLAAIIAIFCFIEKTNAQAPNWLWAKTIGGIGNDIGRSVAVDDSGNVFVGGSFEGTVDFDPGPGVYNMTSAGILDAYFIKLDASGNLVWANQIGGTHSDLVIAMATDLGGNLYLTGRFGNTVDFDPGPGVNNITAGGINFDFFITKYTNAGVYQWAEAITGQGDTQCHSLKLDSAGNIYGSGYFTGSADFNPGSGIYALVSNGNNDAFVFKLENSGGFIWAKSFGGPLYDAANGIAVDGISNVYITGYYNGNIDFDPGAAVVNSGQAGGNDIFISKFTEGGNFIWTRTMGGVQQDVGISVYSDFDGNVYSSGNFLGSGDFNPGNPVVTLNSNGNADVYTSKLTKTGDFVWAGSFGSPGSLSGIDNNYAMAADADGNIYTSGYFRGQVDFNTGSGTFILTSFGDNDAYITKTDSAGNFIWTKRVGGAFSEIAHSITVDNTNHLVVCGSYMSGPLYMDVDTIINLSAPQTGDIFIARLDSAFINTGLSSIDMANNISIYPNPAQDQIVINCASIKDMDAVITILDVAGKEVYRTNSNSVQRISIPTKELSNGLYIVRIQTADFTTAKKVLVEK